MPGSDGAEILFGCMGYYRNTMGTTTRALTRTTSLVSLPTLLRERHCMRVPLTQCVLVVLYESSFLVSTQIYQAQRAPPIGCSYELLIAVLR
jgi:hypothetical protein